MASFWTGLIRIGDFLRETLIVERKIPARPAGAPFPASIISLALLDKLMPQENMGSEKRHKIAANASLQKINSMFLALYKKCIMGSTEYDEYGFYEACAKAAKRCPFHASDIELFASTALVKHQELSDFYFTAGCFLSALINHSPDGEFRLNLQPISTEIVFLCAFNTKKVTIIGDLGHQIGDSMESGELVIHGNALFWLGSAMKGGTIRLFGNTNMVGADMRGGEIFVNGNILHLPSEISGGNIFQNGRPLVKDGKIIAQPINK